MATPSTAVRQYCEQRRYSRLVCDGGLDYLLSQWQQAVESIADGYRGIFYEYINDMGARALISELLPIASHGERARVEVALPAIDARFLELTRSIESCIYGVMTATKHGYRFDRDWWYYRVPLNLNGVSDRSRWPG